MEAHCWSRLRPPKGWLVKMNRKLKHSLAAAALSALAFFALGIPTALVPTGLFARMIPATAADYAILATTSALIGSYISYSIYLKRHSGKKGSYAAAGGTFAGVFGFGCPICSVLLVSIFGTSALMVFFEPYRHYLGLLAVGLFALAFYMKAKKCKECG